MNGPVEERRQHYLNVNYGLKSWLLTIDHKRIAWLYLVGVTFFFFVGGLFATLIRLELLTPQGRLGAGGNLQQAIHHARRHDDFLFLDPVDPGGLGKFSDPLDDRRARPRFPAP